MQLVSLGVIRDMLEKAESDVEHDDMLTVIIDGVSKRFETYLNRLLTKTSRTEKFNGGTKYFYVSAYPVDLTATPVVIVDDVTQTVDDDYYIWENDGLFEFTETVAAGKPKIVSIAYTGGYASAGDALAVPDDLKRACMQQVVFEYTRRNDMGASSVNLPNGSISISKPANLLPEVVNTLNSYRRMPGI